MTQEFHISITPIRADEYLVRTEEVAPGVPLAEEQFAWPTLEWLTQARQLMNDPIVGLLRGDRQLTSPGTSSQPGSHADDSTISNLITLGQRLYGSLFQGRLRDSWVTAQGIAQHRGEALRLRLGLKGTHLPCLPWEVLNGGVNEGFHVSSRPLATGVDVLFSRYLADAGMGGVLPLALSPKPKQTLNILMAIAAPTDQQQLKLQQEAHHLQDELRLKSTVLQSAMADRLPDIRVTILEQPGREELAQALEQGQYHVFHYAGHSDLGHAGGQLYLVNRQTGLSETLSGNDLAGLLLNNEIQLAVFNSCRGSHTANSASGSVPGGGTLAEALVNRGIPAVLAMAEQIPDDVALSLTRLFYRNLKQDYPVDLSLSRARQGLLSAYSSDQLYWALPTLYMHPEFDGYLTAGDRTLDNPADSLIRLPSLYSSPLSEAIAAARHASNQPVDEVEEPPMEEPPIEFNDEFDEVPFEDTEAYSRVDGSEYIQYGESEYGQSEYGEFEYGESEYGESHEESTQAASVSFALTDELTNELTHDFGQDAPIAADEWNNQDAVIGEPFTDQLIEDQTVADVTDSIPSDLQSSDLQESPTSDTGYTDLASDLATELAPDLAFDKQADGSPVIDDYLEPEDAPVLDENPDLPDDFFLSEDGDRLEDSDDDADVRTLIEELEGLGNDDQAIALTDDFSRDGFSRIDDDHHTDYPVTADADATTPDNAENASDDLTQADALDHQFSENAFSANSEEEEFAADVAADMGSDDVDRDIESASAIASDMDAFAPFGTDSVEETDVDGTDVDRTDVDRTNNDEDTVGLPGDADEGSSGNAGHSPAGQSIVRSQQGLSKAAESSAPEAATLKGGRSPWKKVIWLPLASVAGAAIVFLGYRLVPEIELPSDPDTVVVAPDNVTPSNLADTSTTKVAEFGIASFENNRLADGQAAVEELLNRGDLEAANTVLARVPNEAADTPVVNFLQGRLAWQNVHQGDATFSIQDARDFWQYAAQKSEQPQYYNALGFSLYSEGRMEEAIDTWKMALHTLDQNGINILPDDNSQNLSAQNGQIRVGIPQRPLTNQDALTAYAGIALAMAQLSATSSAEQPYDLLSQAVQIGQIVSQSPNGMNPGESDDYWLWTDPLMQEWDLFKGIHSQ